MTRVLLLPQALLDFHRSPAGGRRQARGQQRLGFDEAKAARLFQPFLRLHCGPSTPASPVDRQARGRAPRRMGAREQRSGAWRSARDQPEHAVAGLGTDGP